MGQDTTKSHLPEVGTDACPLGESGCTVGKTLEQLNQEIQLLKDQVSTDALTGLANVRHLRFMLEREMERTIRNHQPTTFFILDADHFKQINDTHGHVIGDKALQHIATQIKLVVRKIDIPCRYGGEEFAVILPSTPLLVGIQVAERVRTQIEQNPLNVEGINIPITVSIGVDSYNNTDDDGMDSFIARADQQLYTAKNSGRNCVQHPSETTQNKAAVTQSEKAALFEQLNEEE